MAGRSLLRLACRSVALAGAAMALACVPAGPAPAQERAAPQIAAGSSSLPFTVGRVRRDASGRIVPDHRAPHHLESYESIPAALPPVTARPGFSRLPAFEPESQRLAALAHRRQLEVSRILEEERLAKRHGAAVDARGLTARERVLLLSLRRTDREVRVHEMAHYFTGRPYTAEPEYWFVIGPLGRRYAVAGHVPFDFRPIPHNPALTLRKFETLRRAALAPAQPSPFDLRIARELDQSLAALRARMARRQAAVRFGADR